MIKTSIALLTGILYLQNTIAQKVYDTNEPTSARSISHRWELDSSTKRKTFTITSYRPVYITGGRWSSNPNERPFSETPGYTLPFRVDYNNYEAKFQLSFKTKLAQGIFGKTGDLWIAYTQKSHWQVYNSKLSRSFRETNYEPEVMLNFATNFNLLGLKTRMLGVVFNHQSNGRTLPLSRSWNRVIFVAGLEKKNFIIYLRPWIRIPDEDDENPEIVNYIGRYEMNMIYNWKKLQLALTNSHPLTFKSSNIGRGRLQFDAVYSLLWNMKGHFQYSVGYGETMIDYNHNQTTLGLGISLIEW
ncbi:phospholipase A [Lacibacter sediminis]|uniref:Phosphatidylcholine 1-acylhydrolase n=1 Tax=Lacibacter sediminis TaxID=2760713 RepID=A0A7G5XBC6_9BACT|nr:phospholipase A [Lacibacter sediminis]QNA42779.1 phospholipase A [Lacibacter sediminis]